MKKLLALVLLASIVGLSACDAIDTDVLPVSDNTYDIGRDSLRWAGGHFVDLDIAGDFVLEGNGRVYNQAIMPIQIARIIAAGKPTRVEVGIFQGFSLPVGGADEELFTCQCTPGNWASGSDMYLYVGGWLDTANDGKNFQLRLSYDHWTAGEVVPNSTVDVDVETATGNAAQHTTFKIRFTIDTSGLVSGDALGLKLTRIAASADEIAGEFVVEGMVLVYLVDKLGSSLP